jgi:Domain of unknown function (DUF397)
MGQLMGDGSAEGMPGARVNVPSWRKSGRSIGNGQCVEAARMSDGRLALRDSKDKSGPVLLFSETEWRAFLGGVRDGDFDSL